MKLLVGLPVRSSLQILHLRFSGEEKIHHSVRREVVSELQKELDRWPWSRTPRPKESDATGLVFWRTRKPSELQEFVRLVHWAFGPTGLPALQILAFGDFSHGDRYREQQVLLWRKKSDKTSDGTRHKGFRAANRTFCLVDIDDDSLWDDLALDGRRFLSACPSAGLMESPYDV